jgi:hypothetical protein
LSIEKQEKTEVFPVELTPGMSFNDEHWKWEEVIIQPPHDRSTHNFVKIMTPDRTHKLLRGRCGNEREKQERKCQTFPLTWDRKSDVKSNIMPSSLLTSAGPELRSSGRECDKWGSRSCSDTVLVSIFLYRTWLYVIV